MTNLNLPSVMGRLSCEHEMFYSTVIMTHPLERGSIKMVHEQNNDNRDLLISCDLNASPRRSMQALLAFLRRNGCKFTFCRLIVNRPDDWCYNPDTIAFLQVAFCHCTSRGVCIANTCRMHDESFTMLKVLQMLTRKVYQSRAAG